MQQQLNNLNDYYERAIKTAVYPHVGLDIIYPLLGLVGETGEALQKLYKSKNVDEINKEFGDILWYVNALLYTLNGIGAPYTDGIRTLEDLLKKGQAGDGKITPIYCIIISVSEFCETYKKVIRDHSRHVDFATLEKLFDCLSTVMVNLDLLVTLQANLTLLDIARLNIEKLESRQKRGVLSGSGDNR